MKGIVDGRQLKENKKEIILKIKRQLHLKNLGLIINFEEFEENKKMEILKILINEGKELNNMDIGQINESFELWNKFKKQRDLGNK
jgi:hypothetical protein